METAELWTAWMTCRRPNALDIHHETTTPGNQLASCVQKGLREQRGSFLPARNREGMFSRPRWLGTNWYRLENLSLDAEIHPLSALGHENETDSAM
jgi:hypothetical protein